jgi:hypothetical protein
MYSFRQRSDTKVVDEPLYANYLRYNPAQAAQRPPGYVERVFATQNSDGAVVVRDVIKASHDKPVLFIKHIGRHLTGDMDRSFIHEMENGAKIISCVIFLIQMFLIIMNFVFISIVIQIRNPVDIVNSWFDALGVCSLEDTGLPHLVSVRSLFY